MKNEKRKKFREHIALNYYDYVKDKKNIKNNFKIGTIKCPKEISRPNLALDINFYKDYVFIKKIYEYFVPRNLFFSTRDIIKWYDNEFTKKEIN